VLIYVFRTTDVARVARELQARGFVVTPEKHGSGPAHYSIALDGALLEIYPTVLERPCDRCAGQVVDGRPASVCQRCMDELLALREE
jgi:hypothetical protein